MGGEVTAQEVNSLFSQRTAVVFIERELSPRVIASKFLENSVQIPAFLHIFCTILNNSLEPQFSVS